MDILDYYESRNRWNLYEVAEIIAYKHRNLLVQLNKDQLIAGLTSLGTKIQPEYSNARYAERKSSRNPLPGYGTPDLLDEGEFYRGMDAIVEGDDWFITSDDEKTPFLVAKYDDIFGLTESSLNSIKELFTNLLIKSHEDFVS